MKKSLRLNTLFYSFFLICFFQSTLGSSQGTWTPLTNIAPFGSGGTMILLSDGTVLCKTFSGTTDGIGNIWQKLTPNANGSYINGTWTTIAPMNRTRLYFSSQILMDGRLYVAGGEYGSGGQRAEVYDPLTNVWTNTPLPNRTFSDANSEILPDGKVLNALVDNSLNDNIIYDPQTNNWITGPSCLGIHNESAWVKLPDNSVLMVDRLSTSSERYIPSLNQWVADGTVPVQLYDPFGDETGGALLLPDGRAFFIGALGATAYYTPSGNSSPGTWAAGPNIPNSRGTPDAPMAIMVDGKILLTCSNAPTSSSNIFDPPTWFYEFNYLTNTFTLLTEPGGGVNINEPCYTTNLINLPDGKVLVASMDSLQYYVYTPAGAPLAAGKPTIATVTPGNNCVNFRITGTLFNGISQGQTYGDDWQNSSNYPIVRLKNGPLVYYCRTFNWNSTSVMRGNLPDTAYFTLPTGLPIATYQLFVIANGNASTPVNFTPCFPVSNDDISIENKELTIYPNPAKDKFTVELQSTNFQLTVTDVTGKKIMELKDISNKTEIDCTSLPNGVYFIFATDDRDTIFKKRIIIAK